MPQPNDREEKDWSTYASPVLRMGVFLRLNPGAKVEFFQASRDDVIQAPFREDKATVAIVCRATLADGTVVEGVKEVVSEGYKRGGGTYAIRLNAEAREKARTAAMGRMLKIAGIPSKVPELQLFMQWTALLHLGGEAANHREALTAMMTPITGEVHDEVDEESRPEDPDDEPTDTGAMTPRDRAQRIVDQLDRDQKRTLTMAARKRLGVTNIMNPGDDKIDAYETLAEEILSGTYQED